MKTTLACVFAIILCGPALAVGDDVPMSPLVAWQADRTVVLDAADIDLPEFQWIARPVVVFADSPADPRLVKQLDLLAARAAMWATRLSVSMRRPKAMLVRRKSRCKAGPRHCRLRRALCTRTPAIARVKRTTPDVDAPILLRPFDHALPAGVPAFCR